MKQTKTELIFILDRSGSMSGLEEDTIGGYNNFLKKYREYDDIYVTTILFDNQYEMLFDRVNVKDAFITSKEYFVRGSTALLDALGKTITFVKSRINLSSQTNKPEKVIFVITTDGMENASVEYDYPSIHSMISERQEYAKWDFIFMAANIDVHQEASKLGIHLENAKSYKSTKQGTKEMYQSVCSMVNESMKKN